MIVSLCFLVLARIQEIIHKNDGVEDVCDERDGWCLPRTPDELRNIISSMISQVVKSQSAGKCKDVPDTQIRVKCRLGFGEA